MKYDIIGDIHGHADELEELLTKLGYSKDAKGVYTPGEPDRQAIFVGDFVDRGPGQFRAVAIAREMVESGHAQAIMGNHELNAGMYHTHVEKGGELIPLRKHDEKNTHQHKAFLAEFAQDPAQGRKNVEWLKNLPLFIELDGIRVVHALWDDEAIKLLRDNDIIDKENRIRPDKWEIASKHKEPIGIAIERLAKGVVIDLPPGISYPDPDGLTRTTARLKWWMDANKPDLTMDQVTLDVPKGQMPKTPVPEEIREKMRAAQPEGNTVFFGHYWQQGEAPTIEAKGAICVDQSVAKGGHLAAATVTVDQGVVQDIAFSSVRSRGKAAAHGHHAPEVKSVART